MEEAMAQSQISFAPGQIVKGTVIEIRQKEVMIDIGYKSEGSVPVNEFEDHGEALQLGGEVDVLILQLEDRDGMVVLSHEQAIFKQNWDNIKTICEEGGHIRGRVKAAVKGGLIVNIGVEAFLPSSQIDVTTPHDLEPYVGQTYDFKVMKLNLERQNIVLSRRELIEEERSAKRAELLNDMMPGDIRKGTVKNLTDFGAFVDLNGLDGLLHITDMSWGRITHPSQMLAVGQELEVVVLDINKESERVSLGLKQKQANPWDKIEEKYPIGGKVAGKVVNLMPYGAFIELEPGVEGLVHVTELSWTKRISKPSDVIKAGDSHPGGGPGRSARRTRRSPWAIRQLDRPTPGTLAPETSTRSRHPGQGPGPQPHQLRRLRGARGGASTGWSTSRTSPGPARSTTPPRCSRRAWTRSRLQILEIDKPNQRISVGIQAAGQRIPGTTSTSTCTRWGIWSTGKVTKLAKLRRLHRPGARHRRPGPHQRRSARIGSTASSNVLKRGRGGALRG